MVHNRKDLYGCFHLSGVFPLWIGRLRSWKYFWISKGCDSTCSGSRCFHRCSADTFSRFGFRVPETISSTYDEESWLRVGTLRHLRCKVFLLLQSFLPTPYSIR